VWPVRPQLGFSLDLREHDRSVTQAGAVTSCGFSSFASFALSGDDSST
jgi:hypothetical protein